MVYIQYKQKHNRYPKRNELGRIRGKLVYYCIVTLSLLLCICIFRWNLYIEMEGVQYVPEKAQDIELVSDPEDQDMELVLEPDREPVPNLPSVSDPGNVAPTLTTKTVPGVIVLGMHRSGTSMLTGLLSEIFSLKTPGKQVTATIYKSQNPKGFF